MSQPKKASTVNPNQPPRKATAPKAAVYRGRVYVRPVERGVVLRDAETGDFEMYLDNFAALVGLGERFADGECNLEGCDVMKQAPQAHV